MIKIEKNLADIPPSLQLPTASKNPKTGKEKKAPLPSRTTHDRRLEVIQNKAYIDKKVYNNRYKQKDTKAFLERIYRRKCAFCEQRVEQFHVEHYRPKDKYYWLAFSWDNLLLACPTCNQFKLTNFDIKGSPITFDDTESNINHIHISSADYDRIEQPKMVNPEVTDPANFIMFTRTGMIKSDDDRFSYTIKTCRINREYLNDERRKLIDKFEKRIRDILVEKNDPKQQLEGIKGIVEDFRKDTHELDEPFLAFRRYAISAGWLNDIIKTLAARP